MTQFADKRLTGKEDIKTWENKVKPLKNIKKLCLRQNNSHEWRQLEMRGGGNYFCDNVWNNK